MKTPEDLVNVIIEALHRYTPEDSIAVSVAKGSPHRAAAIVEDFDTNTATAFNITVSLF